MSQENTSTIGKYLTKRLEQVGLKHIFGVPGDYVLQFFDCLEASSMKVICTCNELNAGYAADAYARINGVGGVCVTYGVGGFSLLNAVMGAYAERLPVIVISGSPKVAEYRHPHLLHHTIGDLNLQLRVYEHVTAASAILINPERAPQQIDETIAVCLRTRRPVYLEIPVDMVDRPCPEPGPFHVNVSIGSDPEALAEAVAETVSMLAQAKNPAILAGVENHRMGSQDELRQLIEHTGYPFAVTPLGKSVLPERHPQFLGIYAGALCCNSVKLAVEGADVLLGLGAIMTDIHLGLGTARLDQSRMIMANSDNVRIKHHVYSQVGLLDFITGLQAQLAPGKHNPKAMVHPSERLQEEYQPVPEEKITISRFYQRIGHFLESGQVVISCAGDSNLSTMDLYLPDDVIYISQAFYLSIGYSVPAALGAQLAAPHRRPVVFVGDGAFQMTAQEVSSIVRHGLNPIIFLMNNDGYTIERYIHDGPYNDLHMWKYHLLPEIFQGGWGVVVETEGDLEAALQKAKTQPDSMAFIEVRLDRWDCSETMRNFGKTYR
ncbi:MAG: alpha-keto acid decarboxylase family protein [Deltaproteobacteria bacterium]|nr:alpha-keto acid decarboxylase family protein [Deltaproteobacteria bacterium]